MIDITAEWLEKLGVKTPDSSTMGDLVKKAEAELQLRIGNKISEKLSDDQIKEFENIADEDAQLEWLEKAYPTYVTEVETEYKQISKEIRASADKVGLISSWDS